MGWTSNAAIAAIALAATTGICAAQTAAPVDPPASVDELVGKRLTAIDGSSITLSPAEGGLAREITSVSGGIQRTYFAFINDKLGTVADANDIKKVIGVFRRMEGGFEIEYADGSTETLALNPGGGLTLESMSGASASCVSWYPEGHAFSVEDKKAALAAFAVKLGIADAKIAAEAKPDCGRRTAPATDVKPATDIPAAEPLKPVVPAKAGTKAAQDVAKPAGAPVAPPIPAPKPVLTATGTAAAAAPTAEALAAGTAAVVAPPAAAVASEMPTIEVRKSEIHTIDPDPATVPKSPQVLASATPANSAAPDQRGASSCLSVESDGMHWGFRNHCGYSVQFAYCVMSGSQLASCRDGAVAGSVAANGFGALVADESLKETDAKHDFRWVACQGGAGEVIPRLDSIDPPSGRCVR
jgi:hypothetical protein